MRGGGRARLLHLHLGPRSRAIDRAPKFSENDAATLDQLVQSEGDYLSRKRCTRVSHQNVLLNPGKPLCNVFSLNIYPSSFFILGPSIIKVRGLNVATYLLLLLWRGGRGLAQQIAQFTIITFPLCQVL